MAQSKRDKIIENLVTELALITTANGFDNNVKLVQRDLVSWGGVPKDKFPALFVLEPLEDPVEHSTVYYRVSFKITLVAFVRTMKMRNEKLNSLLRDVKLKVLEDETRGSNANRTRLGQARFYAGLDEPVNWFELDLEVEYDHTRTDI